MHGIMIPEFTTVICPSGKVVVEVSYNESQIVEEPIKKT
jgi:hypothetical protein